MQKSAVSILAACSMASCVHAAPASDCAGLSGIDLAPASIGMPTNGALVSSSEMIAESAEGPAYCLVKGSIRPVDPSAYDINFQLALPIEWNGKLLMRGGGGFNGVVPDVAGQVYNGVDPTAISRGYAVFGSDSGHQNVGDPDTDLAFFSNDEAYRNYIGDALKKTRDVAVTLIEDHYGKPAEKSYFIGGSKGGGEAIQVAARWPEDWDGIVALYPGRDFIATMLGMVQSARILSEPGAHLGPAQQDLLHRAALEACDDMDGLEDGIISDVASCEEKFDPATALVGDQPLQCLDGETASDTCLTRAQIEAAKALSSPMAFDLGEPGEKVIFPGFNVLTTDLSGIGGSAFGNSGLGDEPPTYPLSAKISGPNRLADSFARYGVAQDPAFEPWGLDPENPGTFRDRLTYLYMIDQVDWDLSGYFNRGGKIIVIHGTDDLYISPRATAEWVSRLTATMGDSRTRGILRYFEVPAFGHASSATFFASIDQLSAIEAWVERGVDPSGSIIAIDTLGVPGRTRPLCDFPAWPRYAGGDPDVSSSFECTVAE